MLSSLCYKGLVTPIGSELEYSTSTSTTSRRSSSDFVPLVVPRKPVRRRRRKSLLPQVEALEHQSYGLKFLSHLEKLVAGPPTSSGFNFRRLPELAVAGGDDDDSRTVVTYISLGASTPRQQRRSDHAIPDVAGIVTRSSVDCIRKPKSLKKRHITYRHSLYLPPMEPHAPEVTNRRHSYTSAEEDKVQQSPAIRQHTIASADLDEKKARYKLQLQRRRRYNNWFFTLYEFDKPANPEASYILLSRLKRITTLQSGKFYSFNICLRLRGLSPASEDRRRLDRLFAYSRLNSDSASSTSSVSCISFGMFDSVSPHNPGQLFCPEGMRVSRAVGYAPSFYCYGCGRNMTTGSSLSSVAGSPTESLVGSRQRPEVCYSFTRSAEFYRSTRAIRRASTMAISSLDGLCCFSYTTTLWKLI
ncbi:unnamed protein product [Mesocestoides corti]|uniref:Uncharacterized protein n=1 Tax=Mesocestoides corti TaxID=53468 RepID=A0A0R3UNW7_MESCO|nr:unnamed protein product [Mesocestoides corti]